MNTLKSPFKKASGQMSSSTAFTYFALFWLGIGVLAFLMSLFGVFYPSVFFTLFILGLTFLSTSYSDRFRAGLLPLMPAAGIIVAIMLIWSFFVTPTVFTGRDQGSIATAAIFLAEGHSLSTHVTAAQPFFDYYAASYGGGQALNFPGFFYTADGALTTQFPVPYIAWLGIFYGIFGLIGFTIANIILFMLFALSFTLLAQHLLAYITTKTSDKQVTFYTLLFLLTAFPFMWFFGHTLSENLAQFLLFFMLLQALLFIKACHSGNRTKSTIQDTQPALYYWSILLTGGLLIFARIEGIAFVGMVMLALLFMKDTYNYLKTRIISHLFVPIVMLFILFAIVFDKTTNFYKTIVKALLPGSGHGGNATQSTSFVMEFFERFVEYLSYGILPFLIVGICGIALLYKKKAYVTLLPLLIIAPILIYLIDPQISADAPWMLRRMTFALLPIGILYSIIYILSAPRIVGRLTTAALVLLALPATITFFPFSENENLLSQAQAISEQFQPNDLLLIDAHAAGSGFGMLAGPLTTQYKKNAVYFFNPDDLVRVDFSQFNNTFLIVPQERTKQYHTHLVGDRLEERAQFSVTTTRLTNPAKTKLWDFPARDTVATQNIIYKVTQ